MRYLLLALLFAVEPALAQTAFNVTALYDVDSRIPMALIPLRIDGPAMVAGGRVDRIVVTSSSATAECRAMVDKFRASTVLLKCTNETDVTLSIEVVEGTRRYVGAYGPVLVRAPSPGLVAVPNPTTNPEVLMGKQLFQVRCVACHAEAREKKGRKVAALKSAVASVPSMNSLSSALSDADYKKLEIYLGSLK